MAQETLPDSLSNLPHFLIVHWDKTLLVAVSALLGAFLKFVFDEWSAKNKARRDMITNVTKSVDELAKKYYWHLANNASALAFVFKRYLEKREELQLSQDPPEKLRERVDQLIQKIATDSFFYYARLTKLTYQFDWRAGSTFLLRDYWAGRSIRNLQNDLREVLDLDQRVVDFVDVLDKDGKETETSPSFLLKEPGLADVREKYRRAFQDEERLRKAEKYLKACGDLFDYELAKLYRDWFKNWRGVPRDPPLLSLAISNTLTVDTLETVREVTGKSRTAGYAIAPLASPSTPPPFTPFRGETKQGDYQPPDPSVRKGDQRHAQQQANPTGTLSSEVHSK